MAHCPTHMLLTCSCLRLQPAQPDSARFRQTQAGSGWLRLAHRHLVRVSFKHLPPQRDDRPHPPLPVLAWQSIPLSAPFLVRRCQPAKPLCPPPDCLLCHPQSYRVPRPDLTDKVTISASWCYAQSGSGGKLSRGAGAAEAAERRGRADAVSYASVGEMERVDVRPAQPSTASSTSNLVMQFTNPRHSLVLVVFSASSVPVSDQRSDRTLVCGLA